MNLFLEELSKHILEPTKELEVEFRLGKIIDKASNTRLVLPAHYPVLMDTNFSYRFKSDIDEFVWKHIKDNHKTTEHVEDVVKIKNGIRFIYENNELKLRQKKIRKFNYDIYMPNFDYDIRLSISEENPINDDIKCDMKFKSIRNRIRDSEVFNNYRIDFTKVNEEYEIEIELLSSVNVTEIWTVIESLLKELNIK